MNVLIDYIAHQLLKPAAFRVKPRLAAGLPVFGRLERVRPALFPLAHGEHALDCIGGVAVDLEVFRHGTRIAGR